MNEQTATTEIAIWIERKFRFDFPVELYPNVRVPGVARVFGALMGPIVYRGAHPSFRSDVMVEAEAEVAFDAREILPAISVPVLLVGGDQDQYFARGVVEETARLIPDCTLKLYEGKDHLGAVSDKRLPQDVSDFVRQRPRVQPERDAEQSALIDQQTFATDPLVSPTPSPVGEAVG